MRVTRDGTNLKVMQQSATEPGSWTEGSHKVYQSANFTLSGGLIGFAGGADAMLLDDLTVKADRDNNGSYEVTEHWEGFTLDGSGYADETPVYDACGNLTFDGVYRYTYDGWNRLAKVTKGYRNSGGTLQSGSDVNVMGYDGLGRRIIKQVRNSTDIDATYHYYFSSGSQNIETRNGSYQVLKQQVWGVTYVDELVQIGWNQDPANADVVTEGKRENVCERFFWVAQDANYNVLGLLSATGQVVERYEYTPYGQRTVLSHGYLLADMNDDGVVDGADGDILSPQYGTTNPPSRADLNGDGDVNFDDLLFYAQTNGDSLPMINDPLVTYPRLGSFRGRINGWPLSPAGLCEFGHQGLMHDEETGLVYNRARMHHPTLGRFMQRDPVGYVDGMCLYLLQQAHPIIHIDPFGLMCEDTEATKNEEVKEKEKEVWTGPRHARYHRELAAEYRTQKNEKKAKEEDKHAKFWLGEVNSVFDHSVVTNKSDKPVLIWYGISGNNGAFLILRPGKSTDSAYDQGDLIWISGKWYKSQGQKLWVHTTGEVFEGETKQPEWTGWKPKVVPTILIDEDDTRFEPKKEAK